jgi:hypothetical protein
MTEMTIAQKKETIIKMKLQTAKILWGENRKEAAFLILESMEDTRADDLRDKMGFEDDFEVGCFSSSAIPVTTIGFGMLVLMIISFLLSTVLDLGGGGTQTYPVTTKSEFVTSKPESDEPLNQPIVEMTITVGQIQLTHLSLETQQSSFTDIVHASATARYDHATATANAQATQTIAP